MLFRNAVFTSGVLAEKALLEEVGGFDETMGYAEDYNLWLRIAWHRTAPGDWGKAADL